jgi:uncharacterized protein YjbJ (UPF0337 family)
MADGDARRRRVIKAPHQPAEPRRMLPTSKKGSHMSFMDTIKGMFGKAKDVAGDAVDKAQDVAGDAVDKVQDVAGDIKDKVEDLVDGDNDDEAVEGDAAGEDDEA